MADNFTDTFTREETLKALRCCYSDEDLCSICPYENTITSCIQLLKRGAFDIIKSQNELISKLTLECIKTLEVKPNDVIVASFDFEKIPVNEAANIMFLLNANFPNNKVVGIPNDETIITAEDTERVIKYLQEVVE